MCECSLYEFFQLLKTFENFPNRKLDKISRITIFKNS